MTKESQMEFLELATSIEHGHARVVHLNEHTQWAPYKTNVVVAALRLAAQSAAPVGEPVQSFPETETVTWQARPPHSDWRLIAPEHLDDYRAKDWEVRPMPREVAQKPLTHRWRSFGAHTWIYDPEPEWLEDHKFEVEWEPVYGTPQTDGLVQSSQQPVSNEQLTDFIAKQWWTGATCPSLASDILENFVVVRKAALSDSSTLGNTVAEPSRCKNTVARGESKEAGAMTGDAPVA